MDRGDRRTGTSQPCVLARYSGVADLGCHADHPGARGLPASGSEVLRTAAKIIRLLRSYRSVHYGFNLHLEENKNVGTII
jgi:hypothetical protein